MVNEDRAKAFAEVFERQTRYSRMTRTFTACCAVCGKRYKQRKKWYNSKEATLGALREQFNHCDLCGKWVCDDCNIVEDGNGNAAYDGGDLCAVCAKERGITGISVTYFNEQVWPGMWQCIQEREAQQRKQREQAMQEAIDKHLAAQGGESP